MLVSTFTIFNGRPQDLTSAKWRCLNAGYSQMLSDVHTSQNSVMSDNSMLMRTLGMISAALPHVTTSILVFDGLVLRADIVTHLKESWNKFAPLTDTKKITVFNHEFSDDHHVVPLVTLRARPDSSNSFGFAFPDVMTRGSPKSAPTPSATEVPSAIASSEWRSFVVQLAVIAGEISPAKEASDDAIMKIKRLMVAPGFEQSFARLISTMEIRLGSGTANVSARLAGKHNAVSIRIMGPHVSVIQHSHRQGHNHAYVKHACSWMQLSKPTLAINPIRL